MRLILVMGLISLGLASCSKTKRAGASNCPAGASEKRSTSPATIAVWCERPDGVKDGPWRETDENGAVRVEGQYVDGKMEGLWMHYHSVKADDGAAAPAEVAPAEAAPAVAKSAATNATPAKERQGSYRLGRKVGMWTRWYVDGTKAREAIHDPTSTTVPWTTWREDGSKWASGTIIEMRDQGDYTEWHPNGVVSVKGVYEKGEKVGEWQYWDIDGNPSSTPQGELDQ